MKKERFFNALYIFVLTFSLTACSTEHLHRLGINTNDKLPIPETNEVKNVKTSTGLNEEHVFFNNVIPPLYERFQQKKGMSPFQIYKEFLVNDMPNIFIKLGALKGKTEKEVQEIIKKNPLKNRLDNLSSQQQRSEMATLRNEIASNAFKTEMALSIIKTIDDYYTQEEKQIFEKRTKKSHWEFSEYELSALTMSNTGIRPKVGTIYKHNKEQSPILLKVIQAARHKVLVTGNLIYPDFSFGFPDRVFWINTNKTYIEDDAIDSGNYRCTGTTTYKNLFGINRSAYVFQEMGEIKSPFKDFYFYSEENYLKEKEQ